MQNQNTVPATVTISPVPSPDLSSKNLVEACDLVNNRIIALHWELQPFGPPLSFASFSLAISTMFHVMEWRPKDVQYSKGEKSHCRFMSETPQPLDTAGLVAGCAGRGKPSFSRPFLRFLESGMMPLEQW